jgi:hypothetical protein
MDVGHYRPGRLSAAEEEAVDGHHHLRVDAMDRPPGAGAVRPPSEARPLVVRPADAPRRPMRGSDARDLPTGCRTAARVRASRSITCRATRGESWTSARGTDACSPCCGWPDPTASALVSMSPSQCSRPHMSGSRTSVASNWCAMTSPSRCPTSAARTCRLADSALAQCFLSGARLRPRLRRSFQPPARR